MDLGTIIGSKIQTSAKINGLWVPANQFGAVLQRFTEPALFYNPDFPDYDLSLVGTLTKIKKGEKFFCLVSAHQAESFEMQQLCLPANETGNFTSSNACHYTASPMFGEEKFDLRLYDFSEPVAFQSLSKLGWFDVTEETGQRFRSEVKIHVAIGHPFETTTLQYDPKHLVAQPCEVMGKGTVSTIRGRCAFQLLQPLEFDPDGFSGSPVFGIFVEGDKVFVEFEGIVTNASKSVFNYVHREIIDKYIDRIFL